ncbi:MAG: kinase, partial [Chloroflexi bacterium]|nr:kinase [Chloroflexota bacterium]
MIISRTPYRISFFGGGTDYPVWYQENGGAVLSTSIDKYAFISCRYLPPYFEHRSRVVYSRIELVDDNVQIEHPAVRETLRYMGVGEGIEVHYDGDMPARTGIGSSSSFTVGLLHALYALRGRMPTKQQLAVDAIRIEQQLIGENVGSQDQVAAAYGGFNYVTFNPAGNFEVTPL